MRIMRQHSGLLQAKHRRNCIANDVPRPFSSSIPAGNAGSTMLVAIARHFFALSQTDSVRPAAASHPPAAGRRGESPVDHGLA